MRNLQPGLNIPAHVGIIMDGNGRWAQQRNLARTEGHKRGLETAKLIVKAAAEIGIRYLSLYSFSTENWKRTEDEVGYLMFLIRNHLMRELDFYRENRIRVVHSGNLAGLPRDVQAEIREVIADTAGYDRLTVNLAINYGGRDEIVRACNRIIANRNREGPITEKEIAGALDLPDLPDPDLIIRTAGELRISNFLLWESAYAELFFSSKYWPDWTEDDLADAVVSYSGRKRRYGGIT